MPLILPYFACPPFAGCFSISAFGLIREDISLSMSGYVVQEGMYHTDSHCILEKSVYICQER
jgi:hypothetical protein